MDTHQGALLLVDDDDLTRSLLAQKLTQNGYCVTEVADGHDALRHIEQGGHDLVLLDIVLEEMSGLDVLERVRRKHSQTSLPIIMATSLGQSQDVVRALELGANDYVTKPFDYPVVLARVRTQLALKHSTDEIRRLNHRLKGDLDRATEVQTTLLPANVPPMAGATFAWHFLPCEELAGDLLNIVPLDDRHVALYVLDVVDHGAAAALLAVMVHRVLSQLLLANVERVAPAEVGRRLNSEFPWNPATGQYFTLQHGVLDLASGLFRFIAAGHPGPIVLPHDGPPRNLVLPGEAIGLGDGIYQEHTLLLAPGDRLYLYSDGLPDAFDGHNKRFGVERLLQTIEQGRSLSLPESVTLIQQTVGRWCNASPHDDVSLLAVERT